MPQTGSRVAVAAETEAGGERLPRTTRFEAAGFLRYPCGCDRNLSTQWAQQKKYFWPEYSAEYLAVAGFTFIPQTGSRAKDEIGFETVIECSEAEEQ